jgi:hypothetical protein
VQYVLLVVTNHEVADVKHHCAPPVPK